MQNDSSRSVQPVRPEREVLTRQRLPYLVGISGQTVGARGLSMHLVMPVQFCRRIARTGTNLAYSRHLIHPGTTPCRFETRR